MNIIDKRVSDDKWSTLSKDGVYITGLEPIPTGGDVVEVRGSSALFLLCREDFKQPLKEINGQVRYFLVSLVTGTRYFMLESCHICKVNATLDVMGDGT